MGVRNVLFALVFVVGGIGTTGIEVMDYQNQRSDIQEAVQVEGTVEETDVRERGTDNDYFPHVRYTYSYEGQQYTATSIYPGSSEKSFDSQEKAAEVVAQYSPGETTTVYVNQDDPSSAFLIEQSQMFRHLLVTGGGVILAVIGVGILFRGWFSD
jgi:N-acetyl-gamma-glutamylphosphate reductase